MVAEATRDDRIRAALSDMARDISRHLVRELTQPDPPDNNFLDIWLQRLGKEVVRHISAARLGGLEDAGTLVGRLGKIERKLAALAPQEPSGFPNLKYAQPKYSNMESVLKHVEGPDAGSGVKLVIMNFND